MILKYRIASLLRRHGKHRFIFNLNSGAKVLDIGCGNASVLAFKDVNPSIHYTGIDIGDYYQTPYSKDAMDQYHIFDPDTFASMVDTLDTDYDAVVCSHNIEHCNDPNGVLLAIFRRLKKGGKLYLSFPTSESVNFPSRFGTLNYYDDETHNEELPNFKNFLKILDRENFGIIYKSERYSPKILWLIGFFLEPFSKRKKSVMTGTWEYYGFESIIQALKL